MSRPRRPAPSGPRATRTPPVRSSRTGGATYTALQTHTAYVGSNWNPKDTPSLWKPGGSCDGGGTPAPTPTPTPTPAPSTGPVCFYTDANYGGASFCAGSDSSWVGTTWNDKISSLKVQSGYQVQLFNDVNYGGTSKTFTADAAFVGADFNDLASSFRIVKVSTPTPPPPSGLVFGPYKDVTVNLDWNTNVISTVVGGPRQAVVSALPARAKTVTWAFATGECGSENWGGVQGQALASANVQAFVNAGRNYILSTGGAAGSFSCGSDAGFTTFINRYLSSNLVGVDFDIEAGQSVDTINNLVQRVRAAQAKYPRLRFSFTLATLGGNAPQSLGSIGVTVMQAIKNAGLQGAIINLMVMDYGSATPTNCTLNASGKCDMGRSAIQAAINLHNTYGVPYSQIELTPMIGGNDTQDETFTLGDVATVSTFAKQNGLAGIHYWSLDRDTDCAPGFASPTCNSYGQAGAWGFTNAFLSNLGL